jgi:hypothetical protein
MKKKRKKNTIFLKIRVKKKLFLENMNRKIRENKNKN